MTRAINMLITPIVVFHLVALIIGLPLNAAESKISMVVALAFGFMAAVATFEWARRSNK